MIKVLKLHDEAQLPKASHPGNSLAWDLYSVEDMTIAPGQQAKIHTGIAIQAEGPMQIGFILRERSSQGSKGIKLLGGVIDPDYQGEWMIILVNLGYESYQINKGDRIAQAIALPTLTGLPVNWTDKFMQKTERGDQGFGSTGK